MGLSNYNITYDASGTLTVTKANPIIVVTPYSGVTYDGQSHTAIGSATGVLGETLTGLDLSGTTHTNAGTYNGDAWTFTDTTGNYNNASRTVNDEIAQRPITVNADSLQKTYGTSDPAFTYWGTSGNLVGSDTVSGSLSREPGETVGAYNINQNTLTAGPNYNLTYNKGILTIVPTTYVSSSLSAAPIVYGTVLNTTNAPITGTVTYNNGQQVSGTFSYTGTDAGTVLNASTIPYTESVTFTPSDIVDYNTITDMTVPVTVNQASLIAQATSQYQVYYTGFVNNETAANLNVPTPTFTKSGNQISVSSASQTAISNALPNYNVNYLAATVPATMTPPSFLGGGGGVSGGSNISGVLAGWIGDTQLDFTTLVFDPQTLTWHKKPISG